jgi:membrane protein DedA with SNARE-associated domain
MAVKPFWVVAAAGLAAAAIRAVSAGALLRAVLGVLSVLAALVATDVIHPPSIEAIVQGVGGSLGRWAYLLVGVNAFLETGAFLGFIAPGETIVLFGGVLAGQGTIDLHTLILVTWFSAMAGDLAAYAIGRRAGRGFLLRHGARLKVGESQVAFVEGFFARHGRLTIVLGRWVGVVRPLVPFLAGSSRMRFWEFVLIDLVATLAWAAGLCIVGSIFWHNFEQLVTLVGRALFLLGVVITVLVTVAVGTSAQRDERKRARVDGWIARQRSERRWLARPAAALWAFVGRIEPHVPGGRRDPKAAVPDTVPAGQHPNAGSPDPPSHDA